MQSIRSGWPKCKDSLKVICQNCLVEFGEHYHNDAILTHGDNSNSPGREKDHSWECPIMENGMLTRPPEGKAVDFFIDPLHVLQVIDNQEKPCRQCKRPNFVNDKSCWWCCVSNPTHS